MSYKGKRVAFLFPGQGAQYVGMAKEYIEGFSGYTAELNKFDEKHGVQLKSIMLEGPEESLKETKYTQPAILFHSVAAMKALQEKLDITPDFVAGHSLGEFSALVANGVLNWDDALHLVHKRGEFMIKANDGSPFAMAAILGLSPDAVKAICEEASQAGIVVAANYNTPVQTVISGSRAGVDKAMELAGEQNAKRIVELQVGGPFHSPMIAKAAEWLNEEIADIGFNDTDVPVVSNVDAQPTNDTEKIKKNLADQVTSSVLWVDSMNLLIDSGVELFIEFGPQKVLAGMMRKINRKAKVISIDKPEDIDKAIEVIES